jgi:hypothetical protein
MMGWNAGALAGHARDPFLRSLALGAVVMVVAAVIVNFFGSRLMQDAPSTYLWTLGGMLASARDRSMVYRLSHEGASLPAAGPSRAWWAR